MKKVGIIQSSYLPWIGYFNIINRVDKFVLLDTVQFDLSWRNRNRIRTDSLIGWGWLTVPILKKGKTHQLLKDAQIDNSNKWQKRHWNLIKQYYGKAKYFHEYAPFFEEVFCKKKWDYLVELNQHLMEFFLINLDISTEINIASDMCLSGLRKNELNIKIIQECGSNYFLANRASRIYIDAKEYEKHGIEVIFHEYEHPIYLQTLQPFISHLSVIDVLFNCGDKTKKFI